MEGLFQRFSKLFLSELILPTGKTRPVLVMAVTQYVYGNIPLT